MRHENKVKVNEQLRQILAQNPIFLDTETTGFDPDDEVVDIGVVGSEGEEILNSLVKPIKRIPADASAIHGISNNMVKSAPTWSDLWPKLTEALEGNHIGIYNESFDLRLMSQSSGKHQIEWSNLSISTFDVMQIFAEYYGAWDDYHQSYTWQKLEFAGRYFSIDLPNSHRALADALLTREVMLHMAKGS